MPYEFRVVFWSDTDRVEAAQQFNILINEAGAKGWKCQGGVSFNVHQEWNEDGYKYNVFTFSQGLIKEVPHKLVPKNQNLEQGSLVENMSKEPMLQEPDKGGVGTVVGITPLGEKYLEEEAKRILTAREAIRRQSEEDDHHRLAGGTIIPEHGDMGGDDYGTR